MDNLKHPSPSANLVINKGLKLSPYSKFPCTTLCQAVVLLKTETWLDLGTELRKIEYFIIEDKDSLNQFTGEAGSIHNNKGGEDLESYLYFNKMSLP